MEKEIIMLDIRFIRENPEAVKENIQKKFQDSKLPLVDEVIDLDAKRRAAIALRVPRGEPLNGGVSALFPQLPQGNVYAVRLLHFRGQCLYALERLYRQESLENCRSVIDMMEQEDLVSCLASV